MNKENNKLVPKLRFPEFQNDGEWEEKELGEIGEFIGGGTPSTKVPEYWNGNIPWVSSSDILENDIHKFNCTKYITEDAIKNSATKKVPEGSVLFVSRVGVGKIVVNQNEVCTSQDFTSFIPNGVINYFVGYYFIANSKPLIQLSQGTSIKGFSKEDLEGSLISIPKNPKEQQKIASCLSAVDDLLSAQQAQLENLHHHKKGLMQGLFPGSV